MVKIHRSFVSLVVLYPRKTAVDCSSASAAVEKPKKVLSGDQLSLNR